MLDGERGESISIGLQRVLNIKVNLLKCLKYLKITTQQENCPNYYIGLHSTQNRFYKFKINRK